VKGYHTFTSRRRRTAAEIEAKIYETVRACPDFSANDIVAVVGGDRQTVLALVKKARLELGLKIRA
jgi:hypothetical protein